MSYLAKRKSNGPKWISLTRALTHIAAALGCNPVEALTELRTALLDGELSARFSSIPKAAERDVYPVPDRIELIPPAFWQDCMIFPIGEGYVIETKTYSSPFDGD